MVYDIERALFCEHFNASPYRRHVTKNFCRCTRRKRPLKKDNSLSEQIDCDTDLPY